jgi:hypothetical protein
LQRQLYVQAMGRSEELRKALEQTYAAHVHNTLQGVLVVDLIREVGALILDDNPRSASVRRAVAALRADETLRELEAEYRMIPPIDGADADATAAVHAMILQEKLQQLASIPALLAKIDAGILTGEPAATIATVRNKGIAHYDVTHDGKDWRMWRVEGAGLTYGQLDSYIDLCTHAVDKLSHVVLSTGFHFADLPRISQQQVDDYIGALALGLTKQREAHEAKLAQRRAELRLEEKPAGGPDQAVTAAREELEGVCTWIDQRVTSLNFADHPRNYIAAACFDIALEHQAAVAVLARSELYGSLHALLRVEAEAVLRGMWFARCATDSEIERFKADSGLKSLSDLVAQIEKALGNENDVLSRIVTTQWGALCSFTHTGFLQVTRRYTDGVLKPSYPAAEVVQALRFAGAFGLIAALELATLSNDAPLAASILERGRQYAPWGGAARG